ncbi:MAG: PAS domain-containing protein [Gammaproteobacteria bacterium]|nr:PAS domain-containing protein [Gammaproteobacteria bacterium]
MTPALLAILLGAALLFVAARAYWYARAHAQLMARIEAFERSLESTSAGTFRYVAGEEVSQFSAAAARLLGLPTRPVQLHRAEWFALMHPQDRARVERTVREASATAAPIGIEYRVVWADGSIHWLRMHTQRASAGHGSGLTGEGLLIEITQLKETEHRLQEREAQLREATAAANVVIWNLDLRTMQLHVDLLRSPEARGHLPESMTLEEFSQLVHPEDRERHAAALAQALHSGEMLDSELRLQAADGSIRWTVSHGRVVRDGSGRPLSLAGLSRDITSRKRSELELSESENRFRVLADSTPVLIWMTDAERRCTYVNQTWRRFRGRKLIEELGHGWMEGVHPDDLRTCVDSIDAAYAQRIAFRVEYRLRHADGDYRHVEDHGVPRFDAGHGLIGYAGCCIDVTDRIRAEREALERGQLFSNVIEELPIGAVLFVGEQMRLNAAAERITGYSREQMRRLEDWFRHFYADDQERALRKYQADRDAGFPETQILPLRRGDGTRFWIEIRGTLMRSGELWLFRDVTAEQEAQTIIRKQQKLLAQVSRMAKIGGWELEAGADGPVWSDEVYRIHELDPQSGSALSTALNFYTPEARPLIAAAVQAGLTEGKPWDLELPMVTARGNHIWVRAMGEAEREVARSCGWRARSRTSPRNATRHCSCRPPKRRRKRRRAPRANFWRT